MLSVLRNGPRLAYGRRWITIGVRREEKNQWETRSPLAPTSAKELLKLKDVNIVVQPCTKRIFTDKEFEAVVPDDLILEECDLILGVKEVPPEKVIPGKVHFCFSHTHKGQPKGAQLLASFMSRKSTLVDYELLTDESGKRVLAFGKYAGYAGMINCLHGIGKKYLELGYRTPFLNLGLAHHYPNLASAKKAVGWVGKELEQQGIPEALGCISFVFTGHGNVSSGAREIFKLLPHRFVKPSEFRSAVEQGGNGKGRLVGTVLNYDDFVEDGKGKFVEKFAPWTTALVNGIYWDKSLPRIVPKDQIDLMLSSGKDLKLKSIADISCDIYGGVEITSRATTIDEPFMYYSSPNDTRKNALQLMTIDNLPAQLSRDASLYFSQSLTPILKNHIRGKGSHKIVERATIVKDGELVTKFGHLKAESQKEVLVLGSGYVAKPAVDYLSSAGFSVTVASNIVEDANRIVDGLEGCKAVKFDANKPEDLKNLIQKSSTVISLLPAVMHPTIAKECINQKKNMITGSYISPEMSAMSLAAESSGITVLNEIGLDPGLDHLSAMKLIDEVRSQGDQIVSFVSWCGGLPAPECADNPFGYKFSWRPQGVLQATQNPARYLLNGKMINLAGKDLLNSARPINIHPAFAFEGIPNRDSTGYIDQYGLAGVQTMFRGTLRYRGFSELMNSFAKLGFLSNEPLPYRLRDCGVWSQVVEKLCQRSGQTFLESFTDTLGSQAKAQKLLAALEWLGALSQSESFTPDHTMMESFASLLGRKLTYSPGERDMAFMFHEIKVSTASGRKGRLTSTLIEFGEAGGHSAMARTVGIPVAVAAELAMKGNLQKGVIAPLTRDIYQPMLSRLAQLGISFKETDNLKRSNGNAKASHSQL